MALSDRLELLLTADPSNLISAMDRSATAVDSRSKQMESSIQRVGSAALKIGAAGMGVGGLLTELGSGLQEAEGQLSAAITAAGQSVSDYQDRIDEAVSHQEQFGHSAEDTDTAIRELTTAYGDTGAALDQMTLVADLAAAKHESLADAATQVAKAHGGAARLFKEFGVQVGLNTDGTKNYDGALTELSRKLQGQAAASVDSLAGKFRILGTEVKDRAAELGRDFGPAILGISTLVTASGGAMTLFSGAANLASGAASALGSALFGTAAGFTAEAGAAEAASTSTLAFAGGAGLVIAGLAASAEAVHVLGDAIFTSNDAIDTLTGDLATAGAALHSAFDDTATLGPQKLLDSITELTKGHREYAEALVHANTNTLEFTNAILAGGSAWQTYTSRLASTKGVTDDDRTALLALTTAVQDQATAAANAAIANKQLGSDDWSKMLAAHSGDAVAALLDLAAHGKISAAAVQGVADAAGNIDPQKAKDLKTWLDAVQAGADKAFAAVLRLAPADIRAQQGNITIANDQARIQAAQDKIKWDQAAGQSASQLAQDQRDLQSAQLDAQSAVLDEAAAMQELADQQTIASGGNVTQQTTTQGTIDKLNALNSLLTGPLHDAMNVYILQQTIAANLEARRMPGVAPGALSGNPVDARGNVYGGPRASGGDVMAGGSYLVGERGPELVTFGASGRVSNARDTAKMMSSNTSVTVVHPDAFYAADEVVRALNRRRILESAA